MKNQGPILALLAAFLFGVSPALAKLIIGEMSPILLAGLLYLGSGIGLQLFLLLRKKNSLQELRNLSTRHRLKLLGAIVSGGMIAPLFLAYAIQLATAFEVSLLLNLETVATTLIAWLVFREHVGVRVWVGKLLLLLGAALLIARPVEVMAFSRPSFFVIAACFFWGIDNNLTRDVDEISPSALASVKGLFAGSCNTLIAIALGGGAIHGSQIAWSLLIGALSYGVSLILFIQALRLLGASRTTTYFSAGPFFGMLLSITLLGEHPGIEQWIAAALMAIGVWALYRENHEHEHNHEAITHSHRHVHDDHHQHEHQGNEGKEPHEHIHTHDAMVHTHAHWPDIHHRHRH